MLVFVIEWGLCFRLIRTAPNCSGPSMGMSSNQGASQGRAVPRCIPFVSRHSSTSPVTLTTQLSNASRYSKYLSFYLGILNLCCLHVFLFIAF